MQFAQVIGQEKVKEQLRSSVNSGRIPHAQLFQGPEGCGSLPMAIAYAQYIACKNRTPEDSCGNCPSCKKFEHFAHPDLHFAYPVNTSKAVSKNPISDDYLNKWRELLKENPYFRSSQWYNHMGIENKQGLISKLEGEAIIRKLSLKSFESEYKFLVLWLPEKMHAATANMLLKLVEEPPEKTLFLMVAEVPNEVLVTISSRTQPVKLSRIDDRSLKLSLTQTFQVGEEEINGAIRLANGNYIAAREIMETSEENLFNLGKFTSIFRLCWQRDFGGINAWVDEMAGVGRERLKSFFTYSMRIVRENFIMNLQEEQLNYLTPPEEAFSKKFYPYVNGRNIMEIAGFLNQASSDIERNANGKIVLFDMALKITKVIKK